MPDAARSPAVTAIVSTYRSARFMRGCLQDLVEQTLFVQGKLEVVVVDSASPENEEDIVREYIERYGDRIRYVRTSTRETVYAAWNRGIALATGKYLTNANTDDRHRRDALEIMAGILDRDTSVDLVYADVLITETANETFERNTAVGRYRWFPWDRNILLDRGCFIGPQPMWRRSLHDLYGGFTPEYLSSGDYEFWLRISQTSDFHYIEESLGLYLKHPDSIEHRNEECKFSENREILSRYRTAAAEGHLVGFLPFAQLTKSVSAGDKSPSPGTLGQVMALIDRLVASGPQAHAEFRRNYADARESLRAANPVTLETVQQFTQAAELALLNGRQWFVARQAAIAAAVTDQRSKLLEKSVQDARVSFLRGNLDAAVDILIKQGIGSDPTSPIPYRELAETLVSAQQWTEVLQVVSEMPESVDPAARHELEAICHVALGDDAAAAGAAECANAAGTDRPRVLVVLGTLAARQGDLPRAESLFRRAAHLDPACGKAWLSLGMVLWGAGHAADAFDAVLRAVTVTPTDQEAIGLCGDMARRCGRTGEAAEELRRGLALHPDCRALAAAAGDLLLERGRPQEALGIATAYLARAGVNDEIIRLALDARNALGSAAHRTGEGHAISLCMIVKNEEQVLARCLASVEPLVDEMVVVDTGSTDRTVDITTAFGARVIHFSWNGNFSDARNAGIDQARGRWILVLDADEVISPFDYGPIQQAVNGTNDRVAWSVVTRNYTPRVNTEGWTANDGSYPKEERGDGWYPTWKVRLFPNDKLLRFSGEIHEMIEASARKAGYELRKASFVAHHYGELEQQPETSADKRMAYYELGKKKLAERPDDLAALVELAMQATDLGLLEEALSLWNRVLDVRPSSVDALFNKGYTLIGLKRYDEAMTVSRRVLDIDPGHKEAAFNYGTCELYVGDPGRALPVVKQLAERHPDYPLLQALLALLCLACGMAAEAAATVDRLKKADYAIEEYIRERITTLDSLERRQLTDTIRNTLQQNCRLNDEEELRER